MAAQAAQVIPAVSRAREVRMIFAGAMAFETSLIDFLRRCLLETKNLARITWIIDVVTRRAVAGFAALLRWSAVLV
jgi:hypothetical protein